MLPVKKLGSTGHVVKYRQRCCIDNKKAVLGINDVSVVRAVNRRLADRHFQQLAGVLPALTWFFNVGNPPTRRAYRSDLLDSMVFAGTTTPDQL